MAPSGLGFLVSTPLSNLHPLRCWYWTCDWCLVSGVLAIGSLVSAYALQFEKARA